MEVTKDLFKKINLQKCRIFGIFLSVLLTFLIFYFVANQYKLYPFGDLSIAWCDMTQQVIPLLNEFKDIISGKASFTYNLENAGGMSFFAVFFFFMASPLSFLVLFVPKEDMMLFMNIFVLLKMIFISASISFYLYYKYPKLPMIFIIALALPYTFSGYVMMYYQNAIWLDLMYLFPLLILGLDKIINENKSLMYIIMISLCVIMNYYIGAMIIFFSILYFFLNIYLKKDQIDISQKAKTFIISSFIAALICGVFIIPSFIEYLDSARTVSLIDALMNSWLITSYVTTIPLVLCVVALAPFLFLNKMDTNKKIDFILLILLMIPLIIDPINKIWHLGSYQSFPCRFAFMNVFLVLDILAINFNNDEKQKFKYNQLFGVVFALGLIVLLFIFETTYVESKIKDLDAYATSLWGDLTSFEAILRYYGIVFLIAISIYFLYRYKIINKTTLSFTLVGFSIIDAMFSMRIYMVVPAREDVSYREIYQLQDKIEDDGFYRVKTPYKITDVNNIGGLGYNTLNHYTSLTSQDYMFTLKKLGYSSYWMEVNSNGGTLFTDALLQNKYVIYPGYKNNAIYNDDNYSIVEQQVYPFGLIVNNDLSLYPELEESDRVSMQNNMMKALFNQEMLTSYSYTNLSNIKDESSDEVNKFTLSGNKGYIEYQIYIEGQQTLYMECFDKYSNSLVEEINESFNVYVNNSLKKSRYPSQSENGIIELGTFTNQSVKVRLEVLKNVSCRSLNVFSLDNNLFSQSITQARGANLTVDNNHVYGNYEIEDEAYLFLPLPYTNNFNVKIDNEKVEALEVFSNFVAIKLEKGEHNIDISITQKGLILGLSITSLGAVLLALYLFFKDKVDNFIKFDKIAKYFVIVGGVALIVILYAVPIVVNIIGQIIY